MNPIKFYGSNNVRSQWKATVRDLIGKSQAEILWVCDQPTDRGNEEILLALREAKFKQNGPQILIITGRESAGQADRIALNYGINVMVRREPIGKINRILFDQTIMLDGTSDWSIWSNENPADVQTIRGQLVQDLINDKNYDLKQSR